MNRQRLATTAILLVCTLIAGLSLASSCATTAPHGSEVVTRPATTPEPGEVAKAPVAATPTAAPREAFKLECSADGGVAAKMEADPKARDAAQRGLNYLSERAVAWQNQHKCYGCHVQAVTLEAFAVGRKHQYDIPDRSYKEMLHGLTTLDGGTRQDGGLRYAHGNSLQAPSKAFGGAALGRHDQWVDQDNQRDLLQTAAELLAYQQEDGSIRLDWVNLPVGAGSVQGAYQAIQTWQQAFARTADPRWSAAAQKSEAWLQRTIDAWYGQRPDTTQDINYAILGLLAAGVGNGERTLVDLREWLLNSQRPDGGWGFQMGSTGGADASNPFATGQTLYTLRMMGLGDSNDAVKRGMGWLMQQQKPSGGWSDAGFGKAEAMWGVLGLVSLDVLSLEVQGLARGVHVEPTQTLQVRAWDNSGAKVTKVEVIVDDIPAFASCGDQLAWTWDTRDLTQGLHIVDVKAFNSKGESSIRRFEVYAGDVYLTQLGSRYHQGKTEVTLRNIAPAAQPNDVEVTIFTVKQEDGRLVPDQAVKTLRQKGAQGAMTFSWDGTDEASAAQKTGERYIARATFRDAKGDARQSEEITFVYDTPEAQQQRWSQIGGQLQFGDDNMEGVANTAVELLDEDGNVVEETRSTASGNYRFNSVERGKKYKVRVRKAGWADKEAAVEAPAAPAAKPAGDAAPAAAEKQVDFAF